MIGSILIATLTTSAISGLEDNPDVPASVAQQASPELASGVPFVSNTQLQESLTKAGVPADTASAVIDVNSDARLEALRAAFALAALLAVAALFATGRIPRAPAGTPAAAVQTTD